MDLVRHLASSLQITHWYCNMTFLTMFLPPPKKKLQSHLSDVSVLSRPFSHPTIYNLESTTYNKSSVGDCSGVKCLLLFVCLFVYWGKVFDHMFYFRLIQSKVHDHTLYVLGLSLSIVILYYTFLKYWFPTLLLSNLYQNFN